LKILKYFSKKLCYLVFAQRERAMLTELSRIPVVESGVKVLDGRQTPFVILTNGRLGI
jgi:hypothetical protein